MGFEGVANCVDAILVDRSTTSSKQQTKEAISNHLEDSDAPQLMLFPEGTCANNLCVFRFNRGAFNAGKPLQLVAFKYTYKYFNPAWTGTACGGNELGQTIYLTACQVRYSITFIFSII